MELLKIWKKAVYHKVETEPENDDKWNSMLALIALIENDGKLPDNIWLITVLADCPGPSCEIFQKSYKYIKPPSAVKKQEIVFFNEDGLFDGLPELDVRSIRKRN